MKRIILFFEDEQVDDFYPLSLSHTPAELLCGILSLGDKWTARIEHDEFRLLTRKYLAASLAVTLSRRVNETDAAGYDEVIFINPRFFPDDELIEDVLERHSDCAVMVGGTLAVLRLSTHGDTYRKAEREIIDCRRETTYSAILATSSAVEQIDAKLRSVRYLWDIVHHNSDEIVRDFELLIPELNLSDIFQESEVDDDCLIYNVDDVYMGKGCRIDGQVVIDARGGPVYLGEKVVIAPHTRIEGPCYVGDNCQLVGGKIRSGCSFGPHCRVGGEVEEAIFHGYSNKYHDGFIGHAYVGEWVNFGAMTTNSDLKNNYGEIKVELPSGLVSTGLNKVGSFIGDHTKTGIGTLLTTGMVMGHSVNLFGGGLAGGRFIPSFQWGGKDGFVEYDVNKAVATAKIVLSRRGREISDADEELFRYISKATATHRTGWKARE
jgi:UDP-N-acetylglucosamine diphosphorylase/glucosamine-1-phosphate N-acetyltransferase